MPIDPDVPLVSCYTGMNVDLPKFLRHKKISGLVLEGFGAGNVPPDIVPGIENIMDNESTRTRQKHDLLDWCEISMENFHNI